MTETPREYKKRIDEQREKRRENRDKLIQEIEDYELVDKDYKAKTKQEILSNFDENEKAEKESEQYKVIVSELENIDAKYQELEELKENLKIKRQENQATIDELNGQKMDGKDETTLKIQMNNIKKLKIKLEGIEKEVEDLEKEIENREQELKEIEETYGKKVQESQKDSSGMDSSLSSEGQDKIQWQIDSEEKPATLEEYKEKVLEKKGKLEQSRGEIIKLLDEGVGIDENLKEKIKGEITEVLNEYNDKQEGSLRMKSARYMEDRKGILDEMGYGKERGAQLIGGKTLIKEKRSDGKYYIMRGKQQLGEGFDKIMNLKGIGEKPAFEAYKDGKRCIIRGNEQIGDWFDETYSLQEIGGKPCFKAHKNGKGCIMRGNKQYSDWFDKIYYLQEIGGKPCYIAEKDGKGCIMRGKEQYSDWFDDVGYSEEIEGKLCYHVKKNGKWCMMRGKEQYSDWFDYVWDTVDIGGKPCYIAEKDGKWCIMRGKEQYSDWFDDVGYSEEIEGKPCYKAKKDGKWCIMRGKEQYSADFDHVWDPEEIGGKPCYIAEKDGKGCIMRGKEQYSDWFDDVKYLQEIQGKPCYNAKKDGKWCIIRGNKQIGDWYDNYKTSKEIKKFINKYKGLEELSETTREKREKAILQRYQKKLNRDELLKIISGCKTMDDETKKRLESEILHDFYNEYKKVTSTSEYQERDKEYRELKKIERQHDKKYAEMDTKKEKIIPEIKELDEKLCQIANSAIKLEDGSRWKSRKLKKTMVEWENLKDRQNEILQEVCKLNDERKELYSQSKEKGIKYGEKKGKRPIIKGKKMEKYTGIADKLKSETTLKRYKELYQQVAQDKQKHMDDLIEQIRATDFGISEEKKQEVIEQLKISMSKEIEEYGQGNELIKMADETEKWLEENWGNAMRQIIELKGKIEEVESQIKEIESKGNGHNSKEIFQIKEKEFELRKQLLALKNEQESIKADLDEKLKSYDGTSIDWTKDLKIETFETWKEWVKTAEREEMKKKYNNERWMFKNEAPKSWRKDVESYPHGRLYSFDCVDDVAVECGDRVGLIALYDCSMDRDYTNSHSDPEYSAVLYFKVGDYVDYRKFVWRHATDADLDNKSLAYKMISDAKLDGDTLQVWLSKGKGEPSTKYEFKINGGN